MAYSSAYLDNLLTYYWDRVVTTAAADAIVESGFAPLMRVYDERMGIPGAKSYDLEPLVMPGLPGERSSLYVEPDPDYIRELPRQTISLKAYAGKVPLALVEIVRLLQLVRDGREEGLPGQPGYKILVQLLARSYQRAAAYMAAALENPTATSTASTYPFILAVSNTSGTGSDVAFASSKTMISGDTFSNMTTGAMTHDKVASMRLGLMGELDPNGIRTYPQARMLVHGPYWDQTAEQITSSPYTSSALQVPAGNSRLIDVGIPAFSTSTTGFYVATGPVSGGPTVVWAGAAASAEDMPPEIVGRDGRPRVSRPIWNEGAETVEIYYRCAFGVGAAISNGWYYSTGA